MREYGLKNKREVWKVKSLLKKYSNQVKKLIAASGKQADVEKEHLLSKLKKLKLIGNSAQLEDVLNITSEDVMERRLQTIVFRKGLTRSVKHARQAVIHKHIVIGDKKITNSGYLVSEDEESKVDFAAKSPFSDKEHPERITVEKKEEKKPKKKKVVEKKKEDKNDKK